PDSPSLLTAMTFYDHSPGEVYTIHEDEEEASSPTASDGVSRPRRKGPAMGLGPIPGGLDARRGPLRTQVSLEGHIHSSGLMRGPADGQDTRGPTTIGAPANTTQGTPLTVSTRVPVGGIKLPGMGELQTSTQQSPKQSGLQFGAQTDIHKNLGQPGLSQDTHS
ncbi:hypothetical protein OTU49_017044, partial [Cherax quadricarinatus]